MKFALAALVAGVSAQHYYSGEIKTKEKYLYGQFRAHIRMPQHFGTCGSLFTYYEEKTNDTQWNEIDIELVPSVQHHGKSPMSTNIIYGTPPSGHSNDQSYVGDETIDWNDWHIYDMRWTPDFINWFLDGKLMRSVKASDSVEFQRQEQHLFANYWTPKTDDWWGYGLDDSTMPWYIDYDWIEYHSYDGSAFHFEWRDDFNQPNYTKPDSDRWQLSKGWGYPTTTFYENHVYIYNNWCRIELNKSQYQPTYSAEEEDSFDQ